MVSILLIRSVETVSNFLKFRILVEVKSTPRDLNATTDAISKFIDYDDYTINDGITN